jgi:DNA-directed RNA polymerase subunit M/transcription elongation factor TFIIS
MSRSIRKIENPEKFRANICEKIKMMLDNEKDSINLEKAVYNYTLKEANNKKIIKKWDNPVFIQIYLDHLRSVYCNLKPSIIEKIKNGELLSQQVPFMTHQELQPEKWSKLIEQKIKRDKNKFENNVEASTDTFTCRKCKSNKCSYYALQTRSADEPMTIYVTCLSCDNRWKTQ